MFCLRKKDRQCGELGLTARKRFAACEHRIVDPPVGTMRPDRGMPVSQVPIAGDQQGIGERQLLARPAGLECERRSAKRRNQIRSNLLQLRLAGILATVQ